MKKTIIALAIALALSGCQLTIGDIAYEDEQSSISVEGIELEK